jgi:hypothetical protein
MCLRTLFSCACMCACLGGTFAHAAGTHSVLCIHTETPTARAAASKQHRSAQRTSGQRPQRRCAPSECIAACAWMSSQQPAQVVHAHVVVGPRSCPTCPGQWSVPYTCSADRVSTHVGSTARAGAALSHTPHQAMARTGQSTNNTGSTWCVSPCLFCRSTTQQWQVLPGAPGSLTLRVDCTYTPKCCPCASSCRHACALLCIRPPLPPPAHG